MAIHKTGLIQCTLERIVAKPILATLTVGTSIILLMQLIQAASSYWPEIAYLRFIVPFIPPFFITRTAKRVNQRRAEYHFVKDAKPYIFVAFPGELSVESLLITPADMFSNSAATHFNCPLEQFETLEALPSAFFTGPNERQKIASQLIENFKNNEGHGTLENFPAMISPVGSESPVMYLLSTVLIKNDGVLKWQGTLTKQVVC